MTTIRTFSTNVIRCFAAATADPICLQGTQALPFVPIAGIIVGMIGFGLMADCLGRRLGSRLTVSLMLIGSILLTAASGTTRAGQFVMFNIGMVRQSKYFVGGD